MNPASRFTVVDPSAEAVAASVEPEGVVYDVLLLAGSPRQVTVTLGPDVAEGSQVEVDGEEWTVADVRADDGVRPRLICIYAA